MALYLVTFRKSPLYPTVRDGIQDRGIAGWLQQASDFHSDDPSDKCSLLGHKSVSVDLLVFPSKSAGEG